MSYIHTLTDEQYNNLYVTSDTHFNHNKDFVYAKRGYSNPIDMNDDMINIINQTVGTNGILLHLGDFCLNTTIEEYKSFISRLQIKELWMIYGNHNNPHEKEYSHLSAYQIGMTTVFNLGSYRLIRYKGKRFICLHYPLQTWEHESHGSMHLHGHEHGNLKTSRPEHIEKKILDCGWDIFKKPLHITEVEAIMSTKKLNPIHHA
jgi:calcineurin-like phosphoesterase family protein